MKKHLMIFAAALAAAFYVEAAVTVQYYRKMDNDRILLMNNDTKGSASVSNQGYYNTNTSAVTYWEHIGGRSGLVPNALAGTNHVMWASNGTPTTEDDTRLWELKNCRAGSYTTYGKDATYNYLPWTSTCCSLLDTASKTNKLADAKSSEKHIGSVIMRNIKDAAVYSPYYKEGIGTIYFDAVNAFVANTVTPKIRLQMATMTVDGEDFNTISNNYDNCEWHDIPFDLFTVTNAAPNITSSSADNSDVKLVASGISEFELNSKAGGCKLFYRVRACVNTYEPARFRIIRTTATGGNIDSTGVVIVDSIVCSYPPCGAFIHQYGEEYDSWLEGKRVLGRRNDFTEPFLYLNQTNVYPRAYYSVFTNSQATLAVAISNAVFNYRYTYLNQVTSDWRKIDFELQNTTQMVATAALDLTDGVGDIEYYYTADVSASYYAVQNYTFYRTLANGAFGRKEDGKTMWGEEIKSSELRGAYKVATPTGNTDFFTRIREGYSLWESVRLITEEPFEVTNTVTVNTAMELVGDHTWRVYYHMPTNRAGETIKFYFRGVNKQEGGGASKVATNYTDWKISLDELPYVPYNGRAAGEYACAVTLDNTSTHLLFEFNDEELTYSVSHAAYQNFDLWTDAIRGFVGYYQNETYVSEQKQQYTANFFDWSASTGTNDWWSDSFDIPHDVLEAYPVDVPYTGPSLNKGWQIEHGMFVSQSYTNKWSYDSVNNIWYCHGLALQLQGCGRGSVSLSNLSEGDVPPGVDTVSFKARAAQALSFNDFFCTQDHTTDRNYAVSAKSTMSAMRNGSDIAPTDPSLSLVAYYRAGVGAYELRIRRIEQGCVEATLWKWRAQGTVMKAEQLKLIGNVWAKTIRYDTGNTVNNVQSSNYFVPAEDDDYSNWHNVVLACYTQDSGAVHVHARVYGSRNGNALKDDDGTKYLCLDYEDSDNPLKKGNFGVGSLNCPALFGNIQMHEMTGVTNFNNVGENLIGEFLEEDWGAANPGRMAPFTAVNGDKEASTWSYGVKAVAPTQTIELLTKEFGSSGSGFSACAVTNVTSFQEEEIVFAPGVNADTLVQLKAGGEEGEPRTDIAIDDLAVTGFRGDDYPNLAHDYGEQSQFVYTSAWIDDLIGVPPSSYSIKSLGDDEYVYTFKTAGSYTFTPQVDIEVSRALVLGGGGAGGWTIGGGGGGGGFVEVTNILFEAGVPVIITVGDGGDNHFANVTSSNSSYWRQGGNGKNSTLVCGNSTIVGYGGGGGGCWQDNGAAEKTGMAGASGGGSSNGSAVRGKGNQGGRGGRSVGEAPGGGGGAGGDGEDGLACSSSSVNDGQAGAGGIGKKSDITGESIYYGGGGGGGGGNSVRGSSGSLGGGKGGLGGGGDGGNYSENTYYTARNGVDGLGGGGGGGSHSSAMGNVGGRGGTGAVILRLRLASRLCRLQPRRTRVGYPSGVRSPYLSNGIGMFTFAYAYADRNASLLLQVATNTPVSGLRSATTSIETIDESGPWTTITNITFASCTDEELEAGVRTFYLNLRYPAKGVVRLITDPQTVKDAQTNNLEYGQVTITKALCYDEPPFDVRSWFGCNLWMNGWNLEQPGPRAFLYDSFYGLSCAMNWSGLDGDNIPDPETGVPGFAPTELETQYDHDDPYVQSPAMSNGVGQVQFRARKFSQDQGGDSVVTLYGSPNPSGNSTAGVIWKEVTNFTVSCSTYRTFNWKVLNDPGYKAVRLSVKGAATGRTAANVVSPPAERVLIDEVVISEAISPRVAFQKAYAFRSCLQDTTNIISNILSPDEQPITGESFGVQVQIVPQQLAEQMDNDSVRVFLHYYTGDVRDWGYGAWKELPGAVTDAELDCVDRTNLIFRSTYNHPRSVISPIEKGGTVVQYWLTCTFKDAETNSHTQAIGAKDWTTPSWYWPVDYNKTYGQNNINFCPYTLIDSVSPKRAWINEVNIFDGYSNYVNQARTKQFIEIAVPAAADLTGWYLQLCRGNVSTPSFGVLAMLGYNNLAAATTRNMTNHYSFLVYESKLTKDAGTIPDNDGAWSNTLYDDEENMIISNNGLLSESYAWALQLVRPTGVIEHQVVWQGTNANTRTPAKLVDVLREADGDGTGWIAIGKDLDAGTIGVRKSHGEYGEYPNESTLNCWKPGLLSTPGKINQGQDLDPNWYLEPNGTNLWIYAMITGKHVWQIIDGQKTQKTSLIVMPKGHSTNITYTVDGWSQIKTLTENDVPVPAAHGRTGTYVHPIDNLQDSLTIMVDDEPEDKLRELGIDENNRYKDAVLDWLQRRWPGNTGDDIKLAEYYALSGATNSPLTLTEMYWLDIPPCEGNWRFIGGMGGVESGDHKPTIAYTNYVDSAGNPCSNVCLTVYMELTNTVSGAAHPPYTINGLEPGSSSGNSATWDSNNNWTSATFKITGALQNGKANKKFMPLRWFIFDVNSFRAQGTPGEFTADVMIMNPFTKASPAYNYGWYPYRDTGTEVFYMWDLNGDGPGLDTAEMLKKQE